MGKSTKKETPVIPVATPRWKRAAFLLGAFGNLAVASYLAILLADLDTGRMVLAGISVATSIYFAFKTIE